MSKTHHKTCSHHDRECTCAMKRPCIKTRIERRERIDEDEQIRTAVRIGREFLELETA